MPTLTANLQPVAEQISELRESYPHSIALSYAGRELSYEELDNRTGRFAGYLAQRGVASGSTVAICMERSFNWIVAALGTMRAGAAYVPVDSAWPESRLRFAVKDSGATALVARADLLDRLQVKARGIDPRRDAAAIAAAQGAEPRTVEPESLAYVIYTSGSTGVPKGVEITHANLCHLVRWHVDAFQVRQHDRASHLAGLGFDAAVWEIWPHLAAGATVCLADDSVRSSPELLRQWIIRERVTIAFVPTVHAARMLAMDWPATTALRLLLTGGDVLHRAPAVRLPFDVVNNYGPTECTVVATSAVLKPGSHGTPPIGRPIAGTSVYLLNEYGEPVPDGSTGEIYISGKGVGRGYRNLPDSTERAFLRDPFSGIPGARMYRTGDCGVRRPDGDIEFRGRLDRQIKIRGQRVELDEIGSVLARHPSIDFATAIISTSQGGENQIVAHVLPKGDTPVPTAHELRKHLLRSLPDYMVPATFVRMRALPVSPNGKLDLTMLAQPTAGNLLAETAAKTSATPIEAKLLTMLRELLKTDLVGTEDNFFLAGGHSLLGMQLVMGLRRTFGVDLSLRQLVGAPTVKHLAVVVETMLEEDDPFGSQAIHQRAEPAPRKTKDKRRLPNGVLALEPRGSRRNLFWVHDGLGVGLANFIGDHQPFLSVLLTPEDFSFLGQALTLEDVATCLLRKIRAVQSEGPYAMGGFCLGGLLAYEIASQLRAANQEVSLVVMVDSPNPSRIGSCDSLTSKLKYVGYLLRRGARLGLRKSLVYLHEDLRKRFPRWGGTESVESHMLEALQAAALAYQPEEYKGKVVLILASERPPHVNVLAGWQKVVPDELYTHYVSGHHREFHEEKMLRGVADVIAFHLRSATHDGPCSFSLDIPESTARERTAIPTRACT
ncbi:MAG TPA: amino acid adenylation domain-containing protein [Candidatus Cybelea sp.]|nr:amino acid adenylation domain-containing protein [Candidatus Cybelea sp.]